MGEVEFFDKVKETNRYLNNQQREVLINLIHAMIDNIYVQILEEKENK
jgi:hypothetical protein